MFILPGSFPSSSSTLPLSPSDVVVDATGGKLKPTVSSGTASRTNVSCHGKGHCELEIVKMTAIRDCAGKVKSKEHFKGTLTFYLPYIVG